jgi:hypothetical protein
MPVTVMPFQLFPRFAGILKVRSALLAFTFASLSFAQTPHPTPIANFVDIAEKAGLTAENVFGGLDTKKYIIETTGTGVAIFDYDNDGWPDILLVNGTTLDAGKNGPLNHGGATNHLYHNNHDGTFTDVTVKAGLTGSGWGQGVCVGDYDNDGWEDVYITYYGKNRLYHNEHGVFSEVAEQAGVAGTGKAWGTGCAFVDYDRDGHLDLMVAISIYRLRQRRESARIACGKAFRSCAGRADSRDRRTPFITIAGMGRLRMQPRKPILIALMVTMRLAFRPWTMTMMAGPTSTLLATARQAFSITTIATAPSPMWL